MFDVNIEVTRGNFSLAASFSAPTPGVIALFGPSGSGKSTLVNAIAGLVSARGHVKLGDLTWLDSARDVDVPAERRRIGYVFQDARLFPHLDVRGNLRYGEKRAPPAGRYAAFDDLVALLGLGGLLARRVNQLSGGERQRVALGRALLAQPRLLLLDEPLAAIDVARRAEVLPYLETLRDHFSIPMLYVSHQYDEVLRLATQVVVLRDGCVVLSGTPAELSVNPQLGAAIGPEAVGAVLEVEVVAIDARTGLASVALGADRLQLTLPDARVGARLRLNILARDVILAIAQPHGLSVRNSLAGSLAALIDEGQGDVLAAVDIADARLLARVTRAAISDLGLRPGLPVWALVKAASLRGHVFTRAAPPTGERPP